ncbi:hypothetical protein [Bradyrhizobium sp.]
MDTKNLTVRNLIHNLQQFPMEAHVGVRMTGDKTTNKIVMVVDGHLYNAVCQFAVPELASDDA